MPDEPLTQSLTDSSDHTAFMAKQIRTNPRRWIVKMYFKECFEKPEQFEEYTKRLAWLADLTEDCVKQLVAAFRIVEKRAIADGGWQHATIQAFVRHICESIDGVAVLVRAGCSLPCQPLLRSSLEAMLGVRYILEKDSEQRALAYQLADAHHRIKFYRTLDPDDPLGKQTIAMMQGDPVASRFALPKMDFKAKIANLMGMLQRPHFVIIEAEWQSQKKKSVPWFGLFGGPQNVRELAHHLKMASSYEFLYRTWSNSVHAGDCLRHFASDDNDTDTTTIMRPLRHPEQLQTAVSIGCGFVLDLSLILLNTYGSNEEQEAFRVEYAAKFQERLRILRETKLVDMNWR